MSSGRVANVFLDMEPEVPATFSTPGYCDKATNMWNMTTSPEQSFNGSPERIVPGSPESDSAGSPGKRGSTGSYPDDPEPDSYAHRIVYSSATTSSMYGSDVSLMPNRIENEVRLRFMVQKDIPALKRICKDIFPIEYPDYWFEDITTNHQFICLAATVTNRNSLDGQFVGILVAEIKQLNQCNFEDRDILSKTFPLDTNVAYILSLGVIKAYRRRGLASYLFDSFLLLIKNILVRTIYLHVLCENEAAVSFYERRHFKKHKQLEGYYQIDEQHKDGCTLRLFRLNNVLQRVFGWEKDRLYM